MAQELESNVEVTVNGHHLNPAEVATLKQALMHLHLDITEGDTTELHPLYSHSLSEIKRKGLTY